MSGEWTVGSDNEKSELLVAGLTPVDPEGRLQGRH